MRSFHTDGTQPAGSEIFVFGSNNGGRHGGGAALVAYRNHGAIWGVAEGLAGRTYAIPTKTGELKTLPLDIIKMYVDRFIQFAKDHPEMAFMVTRIGCGLAGYQNSDIAPLFKDAPENCDFAAPWRDWLDDRDEGTRAGGFPRDVFI